MTHNHNHNYNNHTASSFSSSSSSSSLASSPSLPSLTTTTISSSAIISSSSSLSSGSIGSSSSLSSTYHQRHEFIPISLLLERLSSYCRTSIEKIDIARYSFITILNNPFQIYLFLRYICFSHLPEPASTILKRTTESITRNHVPTTTTRTNNNNINCIIVCPCFSDGHVRVTLLQALQIMLELTILIDYRHVFSPSGSASSSSSSLNTNVIRLDTTQTCMYFGRWLRFIRVNSQDCIPMIRSKSSWLSNSLSKSTLGLYTTDTESLLKKQTSCNYVPTLSIQPDTIENEFEFSEQQFIHLIIQLCLPIMYSHHQSNNIINNIRYLLLLLQNNLSIAQSITSKYGIALSHYGNDLVSYLQTIKTLTIFDRLIACRYMSLDIKKQIIQLPTSQFIEGIESFENIATLIPKLTITGNYVAADYYTRTSSLTSIHHLIFIPHITVLEAHEHMYIDNEEACFDLQWFNGITGCIIPVSELYYRDHIRSMIVRLYSNYNRPQPNLLFAIMSWFASDQTFMPVAGHLTEVEIQDLNRFAATNVNTMENMYRCWQFHERRKEPITSSCVHDWERIRLWLLSVGEVLRAFTHCILRPKTRVFTAGGIFKNADKYYPKDVYGGTWEHQDTGVLINLLSTISYLYVAAKSLFRAVCDPKSTPGEKQAGIRNVIHILCCFYHDDIDVIELHDSANTYYQVEKGCILSNLELWFSNNQILPFTENMEQDNSNNDDNDEDPYFVGNVRVTDRWALIRNVLLLIVGLDPSTHDALLKKHTGKCTPFIVLDDQSQPVILGGDSSQKQSLIVDCFAAIKCQDVSQIMTSLISTNNPTIVMDKQYIKPSIMRILTNVSKCHILELPQQSSSSSSSSSSLKRRSVMTPLVSSSSDLLLSTKRARLSNSNAFDPDDPSQQQRPLPTTTTTHQAYDPENPQI